MDIRKERKALSNAIGMESSDEKGYSLIEKKILHENKKILLQWGDLENSDIFMETLVLTMTKRLRLMEEMERKITAEQENYIYSGKKLGYLEKNTFFPYLIYVFAFSLFMLRYFRKLNPITIGASASFCSALNELSRYDQIVKANKEDLYPEYLKADEDFHILYNKLLKKLTVRDIFRYGFSLHENLRIFDEEDAISIEEMRVLNSA